MVSQILYLPPIVILLSFKNLLFIFQLFSLSFCFLPEHMPFIIQLSPLFFHLTLINCCSFSNSLCLFYISPYLNNSEKTSLVGHHATYINRLSFPECQSRYQLRYFDYRIILFQLYNFFSFIHNSHT